VSAPSRAIVDAAGSGTAREQISQALKDEVAGALD
jgi:hypothetical protein